MVDTSMEAPVISSTATKYISRRTITDKEKKDIKEAFDLFDTNHDGFINYHELKVFYYYNIHEMYNLLHTIRINFIYIFIYIK